MQLKQLILTQDQYIAAKKPTPYEVQLRSSSGQEIIVLGVSHSNPPIDRIVELWSLFNTHAGLKVALAEGRIRMLPETFDQAVARRGEVDAVQWLAKHDIVEVVFPEPTNQENIIELRKHFKPSDIALSAIASRMSSRERTLPGLSAEEALVKIISEHAALADAYGFTPSMDWFHEAFERSFPNQSIDDKSFWNSIYNPFSTVTVFNRISGMRSQLRDISILNTIQKYWDEGRNIFFVYGHAHVVKLEPALRFLVK